MLSTCCLFLCLLAGSYQHSIVDFVVPEAAEVGTDVTLKCDYQLDASDGNTVPYVKWWFWPRYGTTDKPVHLFQRINPQETPDLLRHGIESAGNYDIILKKLTHKDSGKYECEVTGLRERRINKTLTVFSQGTGPQLNITETPDGADSDNEEDLLLECHADGVTPQPELVIYANGRPVNGVTQHESTAGDGLFSVTASVTVTKADMLDVLVRCELSYVDHSVPHPPFIDEETYSSGLPPSTTTTTAVPANLTQMENVTETQQNRSSCSRFSWWLSIASLLIPLQLKSLVGTL